MVIQNGLGIVLPEQKKKGKGPGKYAAASDGKQKPLRPPGGEVT